ncbi:MAG TPA: threonine aldolase [Lentisphaeria bacterium]|nr:MAG: hypothetical protein A2X47_11090 [Lentisphaerae bacterium GWF2_38_69]HBM16381.1 threonine aldolase [Lentisphaeria bacterium]
MKLFLSDNCSGVHPEIIKALLGANNEHSPSYGEDPMTAELQEKVRKLFSYDRIKVFPVCSGTAANIVALASLLHSYEGVICTDTAHINTYECGSLEKLTGGKILPVSNKMGKLEKTDAEVYLEYLGDEHLVQPRAVSISQTTEFGTVYSMEELKVISDFCKKNDFIFHMDGARLANAMVFLNKTPYEMVTEIGVDLLTFGGTKNGLMSCDLIVSFNEKASGKMRFIRKQFGHLMSKMRFVSAQFLAYLDNSLYLKLAEHSNTMAMYFESRLKEFNFIEMAYPVESNMLFVKLPRKITPPLMKEFPFHILDSKKNMARFVTSFDTTTLEIDSFINLLSELKREL